MADEELDRLFRLDGKVALVTGGSAGIGRGIAELLGRAGAKVVVTSRREEAVAEAAKALADAGIDALGAAADVRDEASVGALVGQARDRFGGVDVLVNSAGGSFGDSFGRGPVLSLKPEDLLESYRLNVVGTFIASKAVAPVMTERGGGSVVNISSVAAYSAARGMAAYGATKAALNSLTRSMARELAPGIRVNAVAPGHIDTPRTSARRDAAKRARQLAETPMARYGTPADVAGAVLYLACAASCWVTGEVIVVSGGMTGD
jgi:NAD(P)-dependent dehydrogenase (short-subunit alcohol dehydrogenase family)